MEVHLQSKNISSNIDTSSFVKKPYLKTNYIEADIEEDIDMKNTYKIKNLQSYKFTRCVNKRYLDNIVTQFDNNSIVRNNRNKF